MTLAASASEARVRVVELAVVYSEFVERTLPPRFIHGTTRSRFATWFLHCEPLLRRAIDAGIAVTSAAEPPRDALASFAADVAELDVLGYLLEALDDGFGYIGHEYGFFYGGQPWDELCVFRSGLAFLGELASRQLDFTDVDGHLARYGIELYEPQPVPDGMPAGHWWWFRDAP